MRSIDIKTGLAFVTGASGHDGYFLIERLLKQGWEVHAATRLRKVLDFPELWQSKHAT